LTPSQAGHQRHSPAVPSRAGSSRNSARTAPVGWPSALDNLRLVASRSPPHLRTPQLKQLLLANLNLLRPRNVVPPGLINSPILPPDSHRHPRPVERDHGAELVGV